MPEINLSKEWTSGKIVIVYILFGCLWIFLSDKLLIWFNSEGERLTYFQTIKGCFFVLVTAGALYLLIDRAMKTVRESQIARQETSQQYSELVENANDFIYTVDLKGKFTSVNGAGKKITGYSREEISKLSLENIIAPEYQQNFRKSLRTSTEDIFAMYEAEFIKKDGTRVLLEINSHPVYEGEAITGFQGIARDITERRLTEENLKQSEARYRNFVETANEGIVIINSEGLITFVNQKICAMLDYDAEEFLDNYIFDFMNEQAQTVAREKIEHQKLGFKERFDFRFKRLDGTTLWTSISANPIIKNGKYTGSLGMITDITERKLAEAALLREKHISDSIIESLPGVFYFYDESGKFLRWNRNFELVTGYSAEEIAKMHPLDFFCGEEKTLLDAKIKEVFEKGEETVKANFVAKDGTKTLYFFTGKKLVIGKDAFLVGMGIDISANPKAYPEAAS